MAQRVNSTSEVSAVSLTPLARVVRTVFQTLVAVAASIPVILAATPLTSAQITKVEVVVGGLVAVVSTIQNVLEHLGVIPVAAGFVGSVLTRRMASPVPQTFSERS